ncbi:MAG: hypothetical protein COA78_10970 [Blastopirellula sp.]|nr:MAG: hypothetical protein COA78_10970 [Blastopirellula sp.]
MKRITIVVILAFATGCSTSKPVEEAKAPLAEKPIQALEDSPDIEEAGPLAEEKPEETPHIEEVASPVADSPEEVPAEALNKEEVFALIKKLYGDYEEKDGYTYVNLSGVDVTDADLKHLKILTNLKALNLGNTQFSDTGLEELKGFTELQTLYLYKLQYGKDKILNLGIPNCIFEMSLPEVPSLGFSVSAPFEILVIEEFEPIDLSELDSDLPPSGFDLPEEEPTTTFGDFKLNSD